MTAEPPTPSDEVLRVEDLHVHFRVRAPGGKKQSLRAVNGVTLSIRRGETLGLVGESGCGKTTLVHTILGLQRPTSGAIFLDGANVADMSRRQLRSIRPKMQVVFQDPQSSLNPRMTVHEVVAEPLRINKCYRQERVHELLEQVGLNSDMEQRHPTEFSGGQRQRIAIARALALDPELLILDEPVSALDVSIQAQVINLLTRLQKELGLTYLFIAHDLSVVRFMSHELAVMHLGELVETGPRQAVFRDPQHPYTQSLLNAIPVAQPRGREERRQLHIGSELPDPLSPPSGCSFRLRCPRAAPRCAEDDPPLMPMATQGQLAACWFPGPPVESSGKGTHSATSVS